MVKTIRNTFNWFFVRPKRLSDKAVNLLVLLYAMWALYVMGSVFWYAGVDLIRLFQH